ncbi:hypothetical protein RHSIM_Rhsim13G0186400 [Rhododendron simsii]|uniref:Phospholipase A1 n=1 Tax=Rhododendron simsii TaxID=118357 RepID=A0A834L774_RHOSS|nr:hypothetical protein RHSIM_Rhsim13G0186400 [Rhododendron simsii]
MFIFCRSKNKQCHRVKELDEKITNTGDSNIPKNWRLLSGEQNWKGLLNPLDSDLRRYIIHYGQMAQVTYDNFLSDKVSKYAGSSRYTKKDLFAKLFPEQGNPFKYSVTKYLYATSSVPQPDAFIFKSLSREAWSKESNWMGYVAVATEEGKAALGRRDIVVAWRGTIEALEWVDDFEFHLVSASKILGEEHHPKVHHGWYSIYTSADPRSPFDKSSARDQVDTEIKRLVEQYKDEDISITVVGHSLGAAIATLNAVDIVANGLNIYRGQPNKAFPVTAFVFASPKVGDSGFKKVFNGLNDLHVLRIRNAHDIVPDYPFIGYSEVGEELKIDTTKSPYLKSPGNLSSLHNLRAYLHGIGETQGSKGGFELEADRDIALVNKSLDNWDWLKDDYGVPGSWNWWWSVPDKGMVQEENWSWKLMDHQMDDGF